MPPFPVFPIYRIPANEKIYKDGNSHDVILNGDLRINNYRANNYTLNLEDDIQFNKIYIDQNFTLNINVGNSNRNIVVSTLDVSNGKINIIGSGKLTLYVANSIAIGSSSVINPIEGIRDSELIRNQINKLDIYYKGSNLRMAGGQKINGSLYAESSNLNFTSGAGFHGYIITGGRSIDLSGDASAITQIFYAPNAAVNLTGGGKIKGSIVSKSFTADGGTEVNHDNFEGIDLPPIFGGGSGKNPATDLITSEPSREK